MPPRTANKVPVIVYLNEPEYEELKRRARGEPLSAEARRLLAAALASDPPSG